MYMYIHMYMYMYMYRYSVHVVSNKMWSSRKLHCT